MEIREITERKGEICEKLLRGLPDWFGIEASIRNYIRDVERMPMFVAFESGKPVGFLALSLHNQWTGEIHVMAVRATEHRRGVGRALQEMAEDFLRSRGCEFLTVKTLSSSRECEEYERTRKFYFAMGFRPLEEFKTLWDEANPCLFMVKKL